MLTGPSERQEWHLAPRPATGPSAASIPVLTRDRFNKAVGDGNWHERRQIIVHNILTEARIVAFLG